MKKFKKMKKRWRNIILGSILCSLSISGSLYAAGDRNAELEQKLLETRLLNENLQNEKRQLEQDNEALRKELETVRRLYADLIVKVNRRIDDLQEAELQAAHLVDRRDVRDSLGKLAQKLVFIRGGILEMEKELNASEQSWKAVLDVLQPSAVMRNEVESRIVSLRRVFESSLKPLSLVARRDGGDPERAGCRVVEIHLTEQLLLIDRGTLQGMIPGMRLRAELPGKQEVLVQVVDCKPSVSAAVLLSGSIVQLTPGMELKPVQSVK